METNGFNMKVDYRDLESENCKEYVRNAIAIDLGKKILNNCFDIDFNSFIGNQMFGVNIQLESMDIPQEHAKEIRAKYQFSKTRELETIYIKRKEEISTYSNNYKGDKLNWKERMQAFFKGRLYGGSIELREKGGE